MLKPLLFDPLLKVFEEREKRLKHFALQFDAHALLEQFFFPQIEMEGSETNVTHGRSENVFSSLISLIQLRRRHGNQLRTHGNHPWPRH